jgi:Sec-independent protein secretion pathway component TatC
MRALVSIVVFLAGLAFALFVSIPVVWLFVKAIAEFWS